MAQDILINWSPQETRVAVVEQGAVQDVLVERTLERGLVGNVYLGKVSRVLPGMQSAFIDIGLDRAAFLHVADLMPNINARHAAGKDKPVAQASASAGAALPGADAALPIEGCRHSRASTASAAGVAGAGLAGPAGEAGRYDGAAMASTVASAAPVTRLVGVKVTGLLAAVADQLAGTVNGAAAGPGACACALALLHQLPCRGQVQPGDGCRQHLRNV